MAIAALCAAALVSVAPALSNSRTRTRPSVFLTREAEKNGALRSELESRGIKCAELPCIEHRKLDAYDTLADKLATGSWQWVIVTSPEAASLLTDAWICAQRPDLRIASVGAGTTSILRRGELEVYFEPSKATGKCLAAELPEAGPSTDPVLYPASARAASTVPDGLRARGFEVVREDVYTTEPPDWSEEMREAAAQARFATFASPSAVEAWVDVASTQAVAICIGETSGKRAKELGFEHVHFPDKPGLKAWANLVEEVLMDGKQPGARSAEEESHDMSP